MTVHIYGYVLIVEMPCILKRLLQLTLFHFATISRSDYPTYNGTSGLTGKQGRDTYRGNVPDVNYGSLNVKCKKDVFEHMKKKIKFNTSEIRQTSQQKNVIYYFPVKPVYWIGDVFEYYDLDNKTTFSQKIQKIEFVNNGPCGYNQKLYLKLIDSMKSQQLSLF